MNNDIKNSIEDRGDVGGTYHVHLRTVATGDRSERPSTVDTASNSMGGIDQAAMLRVEDTADALIPLEDQAADAPHDLDEQPAPAGQPSQSAIRQERDDDLEDYELLYADGSTVAPEAPRRILFRWRERLRGQADGRRFVDAAAVGEVDVWAAHRGVPPGESDGSRWERPPTIPTARSKPSNKNRRWPSRLLAVAVTVAVCLAIGAIVLRGGEGTQARSSHTPNHHTSNHAGTTPVQTLAARPSTTTTPVNPTTHKHHEQHHVARTHNPVTKNSERTSTPATTVSTTETVTRSMPPVSTPQEPTTTPSTGTPMTTSPRSSSSGTFKTSAGSGAAPTGGLPDIEQTEQQP